MAISGDPLAIRGHQRPSEAIRGHRCGGYLRQSVGITDLGINHVLKQRVGETARELHAALALNDETLETKTESQ